MNFKKHVISFSRYLGSKLSLGMFQSGSAVPGCDEAFMVFFGPNQSRIILEFKKISSVPEEIIQVKYTLDYHRDNGVITHIDEHAIYYPYEDLYLAVEKHMEYLLKIYPTLCASMMLDKKTVERWADLFNTALLDMSGFPEGFDIFSMITYEEFLEYTYGSCVYMSPELMKAWEGEKVV